MPKIIDHDKYRAELAERAARLFSQYGYTGLGMRKIASELGISKSALYHYFPTKQELFFACTDFVTRFEGTPVLPEEGASLAVRASLLMDAFRKLEGQFPDEMSLMVDYLRGRSTKDIASDPTMALANSRFEGVIAQYFEGEDVKPVLCLLLGTLLMRFFDGGETKYEEIEAWLVGALEGRR